MSGQPKYFKFRIPYGNIHQTLRNGNYRRVIFYVDMPSIARGFYNRDVVQLELSNYIESINLHQSIGAEIKNPTILFEEASEFFNGIYNQFSSYYPQFITFYDNGECKQNKTLWKGYKDKRISGTSRILTEDWERELFYEVKKYYYTEFVNRFTIPNLSKVLFWQGYEADLIPHFIRKFELMGSHHPTTLNVILSLDKDLLQTCQFKNVIQVATLYLKKEGKLQFNVLDDENAISYIYKKFQRGMITSEYIPLLLSIGGDKADEIDGIKGVGEAKAYKLILKHRLPPVIKEHTPLPSELEPHRDLLVRNFKLISFDEQLSRIPITEIDYLKSYFGD